MVGNRGNRYFPCTISWEARYVQFLLCSVSTVLFLSPQPAFCLHKEQKAHLKPGAMVVQKKKSKKNQKKSLASDRGLAPADVDMVIREAHPAMALLPLGQSQQISRYCQHCCFICPPHISPGSHTTGRERKPASDLPLCT